jgi:hypothetical protein
MMQHHNEQEKPPKIIGMKNNLSPKNHKNTNPKEITSHPKNNPSDPKNDTTGG